MSRLQGSFSNTHTEESLNIVSQEQEQQVGGRPEFKDSFEHLIVQGLTKKLQMLSELTINATTKKDQESKARGAAIELLEYVKELSEDKVQNEFKSAFKAMQQSARQINKAEIGSIPMFTYRRQSQDASGMLRLYECLNKFLVKVIHSPRANQKCKLCKKFKSDEIRRHIITRHVKIKVLCRSCNTPRARTDHCSPSKKTRDNQESAKQAPSGQTSIGPMAVEQTPGDIQIMLIAPDEKLSVFFTANDSRKFEVQIQAENDPQNGAQPPSEAIRTLLAVPMEIHRPLIRIEIRVGSGNPFMTEPLNPPMAYLTFQSDVDTQLLPTVTIPNNTEMIKLCMRDPDNPKNVVGMLTPVDLNTQASFVIVCICVLEALEPDRPL
ncbi:hypothetical protein BGW38_001524 [Lunasporangiospora selenospora]|uniref:Uncharacterized protein n=1 Tax=Lunasporangiospora selenospora TaxID=979761 RepID=A0A9P6G1F7_9FUNG|nr:hypothetical protein BGW38_001524 [Lunasporangiospora selenospora]